MANNYDSCIGIHMLSHMLRERANIEYLEGDINKVEKIFLESIAISNNGWSMMQLAIFYEENYYADELIEKYYRMAIDTDNCIVAMFNFADYYKERGDVANMKKYYKMAIETDNDLESMLFLAAHYAMVGDTENMNVYFKRMFDVKNVKVNLHEYTTLELPQLACLLNYAENNGVSPSNVVLIHFKQIYQTSTEKDIIVYKNKISLFTRLNHVTECGICYDNKLNIDLVCGHCVCKDCYLHLFKKPCPFCRM